MKYGNFRLKDLREDRDLKQRDVAIILGMSQTGYSKYECGTNDVPTSVLIKLSDFYNVSVDYILGITDIKTRHKDARKRILEMIDEQKETVKQ